MWCLMDTEWVTNPSWVEVVVEAVPVLHQF